MVKIVWAVTYSDRVIPYAYVLKLFATCACGTNINMEVKNSDFGYKFVIIKTEYFN